MLCQRFDLNQAKGLKGPPGSQRVRRVPDGARSLAQLAKVVQYQLNTGFEALALVSALLPAAASAVG